MKTHIKLSADARYKRVIVCGSPERAALIAGSLDQMNALEKNREYHSYVGQYLGKDILVISHGIGAPGAAICFHELIDVGAKVILRVGTAGGLPDSSEIGDIIIATAAIRNDGVSRQMVPLAFPAVPDFSLTSALINTFNEHKTAHTTGIVLTGDIFYSGLLDNEWLLYQTAGAVAVEMECSTLFIVGQLCKIKTAAVLVLDGKPLKWTEGMYDPNSNKLDKSIRQSISLALRTLAEAEIDT